VIWCSAGAARICTDKTFLRVRLSYFPLSAGPAACAFMPRNVPHAWKNSGSETARVLFLYTPAARRRPY